MLKAVLYVMLPITERCNATLCCQSVAVYCGGSEFTSAQQAYTLSTSALSVATQLCLSVCLAKATFDITARTFSPHSRHASAQHGTCTTHRPGPLAQSQQSVHVLLDNQVMRSW